MFYLQVISQNKVFVTEMVLDKNGNIDTVTQISLDLDTLDLLIEDANIDGNCVIAKSIAIRSHKVTIAEAMKETLQYDTRDRTWKAVGQDIPVHKTFKKIITCGRNLKVIG